MGNSGYRLRRTLDTIVLGPQRRRRSMHRRLRVLDRLPVEEPVGTSRSRRPRADRGAAPRPAGRAPREGLRMVVIVLVALGLTAGVWRLGFGRSAAGLTFTGDAQARHASVAAAPPGVSRIPHPQRLLSAKAAPAGTTAFTYLESNGSQPVAWEPCRPIHYVVRPDHAIPGAAALISSVVAEVGAATGLRFVDDGSTHEAPNPRRSPYQPLVYGGGWVPLLVTWSSPAETPELAGSVVGLGGAQAWGPPGQPAVYITGEVTLDSPALAKMSQGSHGADAVREVLLHEFGHAVGLGHVPDRAQVMNPEVVDPPLPHYQPGDLAGLAHLGDGRCFTGY